VARTDKLAAGVLLAVLALLAAPRLPTPPTPPENQWLAAAERGGQLPWWCPEAGGGYPLLGSSLGAGCYPLRALDTGGARWRTLIHLLLAAGGGYLALRRLSLAVWPAAAGAAGVWLVLARAAGGVPLGVWEGACWLTWLAAGLAEAARGTARGWVLAAGAAALVALAGGLPLPTRLVAAVALLGLAAAWPRRRLGPLLAAGLLATALTAVQWLPWLALRRAWGAPLGPADPAWLPLGARLLWPAAGAGVVALVARLAPGAGRIVAILAMVALMLGARPTLLTPPPEPSAADLELARRGPRILAVAGADAVWGANRQLAQPGVANLAIATPWPSPRWSDLLAWLDGEGRAEPATRRRWLALLRVGAGLKSGGGLVDAGSRPFPELWLCPRWVSAAGPAQAAALTRRPDWRPDGYAILERQAVEPPRRGRVGEVLWQEVGRQRVTARVWCEQPHELVLARGAAPGWQARIDGAPAPVEPVDAVLLGVAVGGGTHRVDFVYNPIAARLGLWLSLAGLAAGLGWAVAADPNQLVLSRRAAAYRRAAS
jgi:hypothetical protein